MSHLEQYKNLSKEWFYLKRDPGVNEQELDDINLKLTECWKKMSVIEHYEANNFMKHLKKK